MVLKMNQLRFSLKGDKDVIVLDWNKSEDWLLHHILWNIVKEENEDKKLLVGYLNCFIKFCNLYNDSEIKYNITDEEVLYCLRTSLLHESAEVRAVGIRCIRYFIKTKEHVNFFYKLNLDYLIARSIDICLDNKAERLQAFRLIRKLILVSYHNFSFALIRCLIAVINDGSTRDNKETVLRVCLGYLSELILLNPELCYKCNVFDSMTESLCRSNHSYNILESIIGTYLHLINYPELAIYIDGGTVLDKFIGVFTDYPYFSWLPQNDNKQNSNQNSTILKEDIENRFQTTKNIFVSLFRSWPGLIYLCRTSKSKTEYSMNSQSFNIQQQNAYQLKNLNSIQSLIELMYLPFDDTRKHLMEMIFELFYLPIPEWTNDFEKALFSTINSKNKDNWNLYNGFVSSEAKFLLPRISKGRLNFMDNYISLLLFSFISNGVLNGLVSIIIKSTNINNSVRATILLGELLYLTNQYLPLQISQSSQIYHSLPQLMNACISTDLTIKQKNLVNAAMSCLNKMHILKKQHFTEYSLNLDLLSQFSNPSYKSSFYEFINNKWKVFDLYYTIKENEENSILNAIRESQILLRDYNEWDWSLISFLLKVPSDYMKKMKESSQKMFIQRLVTFFKPSSKQFSSMDVNDVNSKEIIIIGLYLIEFLIEGDESKLGIYVNELITDLNICLSKICTENTLLQNCVLGPIKMFTTLSSNYFLYIGRLSNTNKGRSLLEKNGIYESLMKIVGTSHIAYTKLIISSLDYNQKGFSRNLLNKVLICDSVYARYYATNFLRILLRTKLQDFHKWVIKLLINQLKDTYAPVSLAALDILDEACDNQNNLLTLISLKPSLLHLKDKGILLFTKFASCKEGFTYLHNNNLLSLELKNWKSFFYLKYVCLIEDLLNETFTYHQKNEERTYGRRMDKKHFMVKKDTFIPPHLYGELAMCKEGLDFLVKENVLFDLINEIKLLLNYDDSNILNGKKKIYDLKDYKKLTVFKLKGVLWSCSHIASTSLGIELVKDTEFIQFVVGLANSCPLLSIRATSFYCLGLISKTEIGCDLLKEYDWIAIRHSRDEKWPLFKEVIENDKLLSFSSNNFCNNDYNSLVSSLNMNHKSFQDISALSKRDYLHDNENKKNAFKDKDFQLIENNIFEDNVKTLSEKSSSKKTSIEINLEIDDKNFPGRNNKNNTFSSKNINSFLKPRPRSLSCHQKEHFNFDEKFCNKYSKNEYQMLEPIQNIESFEENDFIIKDNLQSNHITRTNFVNTSDEHPNHEEKTFSIHSDIDKLTFNGTTSSLDKNLRNESNLLKQPHKKNYLPRRKISQLTTSLDFKTYHLMLVEQSKNKNIYCDQLKQQMQLKNANISFGLVDQDENNKKLLKIYEDNRLALSLDSTFIPKINGLNTIGKKKNKNSLLSVNSSNVLINNLNESLFFDGDSEVFETSIPSTEDTIGYVALNALENKKDKYSSNMVLFNNEHNGFKEMFLQNTNNFLNLTTNEIDFNKDYNLNKVSFQKEEKKANSNFYMSICLPKDLSMLFNLEFNTNKLKDEQNSRKQKYGLFEKINFLPKSTEAHLGFNLHTKEKCLLFTKHPQNLIKTGLEDDLQNKSSIRLDLGKVSFAESNLDEKDKIEIRKEVIRLVCRLSFSMNIHRVEDSLLSLKQKYPLMFQDVCLYSEVCLYIANYSFLLQSRRFLQELFLDVNFELLFKESREIFNQKKAIHLETVCI